MSNKRFIVFIILVSVFVKVFSLDSFIRINQLGYSSQGLKRAILISESELAVTSFSMFDALTNQKLADFNSVKSLGPFEQFKTVLQLDFTGFSIPGAFYIQANHVYSPLIYIDNKLFNDKVDLMLHYLRQQRCGFNPVLRDYCHQHESVVVGEFNTQKKMPVTDSKTKKITQHNELIPQPNASEHVDLTGGWHQSVDNIKYSATTAVTVYQLLQSYRINPSVFSDTFDANGLPYPNKLADVLDEARWGLEWLIKMNPTKQLLYVQVGDDRATTNSRLPALDTSDYGLGDGVQPVYVATAGPQGVLGQVNKSTGLASLAGKMASAFALGADVFSTIDKSFSDTLSNRAKSLYVLGKQNTGVCQSIPAWGNDYMKEDNWSDDMELAASQLYDLTFEPAYRNEAAAFGRLEPIMPWLFSDTVNHYQWYPYTNMGHYMLANSENPQLKNEFVQNIRFGLQRAELRGKSKPFGIGVPMVRQSNSYIVSLASQCNMYRKYTGDSSFVEMETALVDWLFGCNPWGVSMLQGLDLAESTIKNPNSIIWEKKGILPKGGLLSGPVSASVMMANMPKYQIETDVLSRFHTKWAVMPDAKNAKVTNEIAIEGTASLIYLLSLKQLELKNAADLNVYKNGAVVQTDKAKKQISLVFSGDRYSDGAKKILNILEKQNVKASFFLTGNFLGQSKNKSLVKRIFKQNHCVGLSSNQNLNYVRSEKDDELVVSRAQFMTDLRDNVKALEKFGFDKSNLPYFLPPMQYVNDSIELWSKQAGVRLVLPTAGLLTNADISVPEMRDKYYSSDEIEKDILGKAQSDSLRAAIILFHLGTSNLRADKFYNRLDSLLKALRTMGYEFSTLPESVDGKVIEVGKKAKK